MIYYSIIQKSQLENAQRIDAQYFQPEYLKFEKAIYKTNAYIEWGKLDGKFITGPFGSEFDTANYIENGEYRYVRGKDVRPFFLLNNDSVYIPESAFEKLKKYSLKEGDILISVVGTLGYTAIVDKQTLPGVFSCKSTIFRSDGEINTFYLIAYLNSKYGYSLLIRNERGANQTGLNIGDLKTLPIFVPTTDTQNKIGELIINSRQTLEDSISYYQQAENLLLEELGLKDFQAEDDLSFVVNIIDVNTANRVDADYFQPKYEKLIKIINNYQLTKLKELGKRININIKPKKEILYKYIEIGDINVGNGDINFNKIIGKNLPVSATISLEGNELIISKVRPTRGAIAIIPNEFKDNFVCSNAFSVFDVNKTFNEYLLVVLKSIVGKLQLEKPTTGTSYPTVTDQDVENIFIPILSKETQQRIAELVRKSHEARKKSKELLEEAKRRVEEMIEKGKID